MTMQVLLNMQILGIFVLLSLFFGSPGGKYHSTIALADMPRSSEAAAIQPSTIQSATFGAPPSTDHMLEPNLSDPKLQWTWLFFFFGRKEVRQTLVSTA